MISDQILKHYYAMSTGYTSGADVFQWDSSFLTNIDEIDEHHRKLVFLINDLSKSLLSPFRYPSPSYDAAIAELSQYAREHFAAEERLMHEYQLDARHRQHHVAEHRNFLKDGPILAAVSEEVSQSSSEALIEYLVDWVAIHILHVDQSMARQIALIRAGFSPQRAYLKDRQAQQHNVRPLVGAVRTLMRELNTRRIEQHAANERMEEAVMLRTREFEEFNQHLKRLSTHDELTGLPNRRFALMTLKRVFAEHQRYRDGFAVVLLDADGFKQVNDTFGHAAGDRVLQNLAKRLKGVVRDSDTVCRLGGDEFLIICPHTAKEGALEVGKKILEARAPFFDSDPTPCWDGGVSVGIAVQAPDRYADCQALLNAADKALYRSKHAGRGRMTFADDDPDGVERSPGPDGGQTAA